MDDLLQEMIDPEPPRHDAARRRRLWATVAVFGLAAVGITSLTTSALFTDKDTVAGDLLSGTVDVAAGMTPFTLPNPGGLAPGGSVTSPVTVQNAGSLALRYQLGFDASTLAWPATSPSPTNSAGTGTPGTGDLRSQLSLTVWGVAAATDCTDSATPTTGGPTDATVASIVSPGVLLPFARANELAAGTTSYLCARVTMSSSAGNDFQYTGATVRLLFDAEQVANNPLTP